LRKLFATTVVSICLVALAGCAHATSSSTIPATNHSVLPKGVYGGIGPSAAALLQVLLGDAPPNLGGKQMSALNIAVKEVDGIENGNTTVLAQFDTPYVVNVLNEPGDGGQVVANAQVSRSSYQELRIVVDLHSSTGVFSDGTSTAVNFQTGLPTLSTVSAGSNTTTSPAGPGSVAMVVNQPFSIPQDGNNAVRVDFNAFESLTLAPDGSLNAQPALFVAPIDDAGSVQGHVVDSNGNAVQNAVAVTYAADGSIGNTASTDANGNFQIHTLQAGSYTLRIYNHYTNAAGMSYSSTSGSSQQYVSGPSATVVGGQDTNVGTIVD